MFPSFNTNFKFILVSNQIRSSKHLQEEGGLFIPYFCTFLHLSCLQLRYTISFLLGVECSRSYPFAYLNGWFCCKTKEERPTLYGITPQHEIKSGTCDGFHFNRQSVCCKDEKYTRCSDKNKCLDYNGSTGNYCILHPQNLLGILRQEIMYRGSSYSTGFDPQKKTHMIWLGEGNQRH